ncbi:Acyl-CoA synthetase (AMP-forming)/AMP-acid ligase II [Prauserella aidingensis]|uniref:aldehyde dehydrogenase family protein n=1 Tax=Prauserella aidingensis TaxID=387890 RepID=UPI0026464B77|nr:aldehyde dehydrogenase family protein [Prauserella aidingensis]MCP2253720.1 Acyl-CoA synthetase (AMP-forming)/AMP-acid ligase II [Prauserella aidingensis]
MLVNVSGELLPTSDVVRDWRNTVRLLQDRGLSEGERVALSADNSGDLAVTLIALMELGVSIALIDRGLAQAECADLVSESGADWFISDHPHLDGPFDRVEANWLNLDTLAAERSVYGDADHGEAAERPEYGFPRWAERQDGLIVWTSGSSGRPKGVVRTGASVLRNIDATQARMGYDERDVLLPLLPFTHQYGLSLLMLWWKAGCTLAVVPSKRIDHALDTIKRHRVTVVDTVPASYELMLRLINSRRLPKNDIASVRMWCVGGEPLRDSLRTRFAEQIGSPLLDGYGSSEAGNIALAGPDAPAHCGPPLDGVAVEIRDHSGHPVDPGEIGEVVVHTPDLMHGVLELDGDIRPADASPLHTEDIGFVDEHGNLCVLGRKNAVHRFGHTLYPDAIAAKAAAAGVPVSVVPVEDANESAQLVFLVEDPGRRTSAHWRRALSVVLAEHERPDRIVVLDEFQQLGNGKVDRRTMHQIAASAVAMDGVKGVIPVKRDPAGASETARPSVIPFPDRLENLDAVAGALRERRGELLAVLTEVCDYKTAYGEIDASIAALEGAAAEVTRFEPGPVDQIAVLMPSNIPLYSYVLYLLIPSLYSRRVVFRPSRRISDQTRKLHELLSGLHGLPIVLDENDQRTFMAEEGAASNVLVFTGTYGNAEKIRAKLRSDQLLLYFGQGVNPFIVAADADLQSAVDGLIRARMLNSGQDCFGPDVVYVDAAVGAQFCNLLCRRVEKLRYGTFDDPNADYGAMFYLDAFDASLEFLSKNRDYLAVGGQANFADNHLRPTVLIQPANQTMKPPELFAPIFNVVPFTSLAWLHEAVMHPYFEERSLAATVYGTLPETVEMLGTRHVVTVNETIIDVENGNLPFGGTGIRANYAAIGKKRYAQPLLISKAVADHLTKPAADSGAATTERIA